MNAFEVGWQNGGILQRKEYESAWSIKIIKKRKLTISNQSPLRAPSYALMMMVSDNIQSMRLNHSECNSEQMFHIERESDRFEIDAAVVQVSKPDGNSRH